ncbi:hypothetical protein H8356DRAFT_1434467 [Neocallimastix lanati (nom. inval.)]|nr:hypothetical protein H8356DRAFT_1434467 [Neocallimastix sp. JGI-2020a]
MKVYIIILKKNSIKSSILLGIKPIHTNKQLPPDVPKFNEISDESKYYIYKLKLFLKYNEDIFADGTFFIVPKFSYQVLITRTYINKGYITNGLNSNFRHVVLSDLGFLAKGILLRTTNIRQTLYQVYQDTTNAPMPYHFGVDALNTLTNEDLQYAGITPLQAIVDDDLFDLGLSCQMDYNGVYALTIDPILRSQDAKL